MPRLAPFLIAGLLILPVAAAARTSAPPPAKPVGPQFFTGRWFEIARTYNSNQKDCQAPTYDFSGGAKGQPQFVLTCRKGSPSGPTNSMKARIKLPASADRSRFRVQALGGLINQDYLVLDRADDYSWAMMGTTGGNYIWLMARDPQMAQGERETLTRRMAQMGYDTGRLVFPKF